MDERTTLSDDEILTSRAEVPTPMPGDDADTDDTDVDTDDTDADADDTDS
jgi:hypothetical protein